MTLRSFYSNVLYAKDPAVMIDHPLTTSKSSPYSCLASLNKDKTVRVSGSLCQISENFILAVEKMESDIMVPTKLLDIPVKGDRNIPDLIAAGHINMYEIFASIKKFKEKLEVMTVTQEDLRSLTVFELQDIISNFKSSQSISSQIKSSGTPTPDHNHNSSASSNCDSGESGIWSTHDSSVEAEVLDSLAQVTLDTNGMGLESGSEDSDEDGPTSYVVKKTLNSARGFCAFLIELSHVSEYVIRKYMEEMQVDN